MGRKRRSSSSAAAFAAGDAVEVRSDDAGFVGAWYEGTVASSPRPLEIIYATLVSDADPSLPLREPVLPSQVRPRPPPPDPAARYSLHHLVDAFHDDGWWPGVISSISDTLSLYTVCFPSSREVFDFPPAQLRPRLHWHRGQWLLTPVADKAAMFWASEKVEVSGDRENYGAVWFPGTITKPITNSVFLVEYKKSNNDGGDRVLVEEILDGQYIRPVRTSPPPKNKAFAVGREVELFLRGGWMTGAVWKVVDGWKYVVKLQSDGEEVEVNHSEVRGMLDWINGRWVRANKAAMFWASEKVEVSGDRENYGVVWFPRTITKPITNSVFLVEYKKSNSGCGDGVLVEEILDGQYIRPVRTSSLPKHKAFAVGKEVELFLRGGWMTGAVCKVVDGWKYVVKLQSDGEEVEVNHSEVRGMLDWINGRWVRANKRRGCSLPGKRSDLPISVSPSASSDAEHSSKIISKRKLGKGPSCEDQVEAFRPSKEPKEVDSSNQLWMEMDPKTPTVGTEVRAAMQELVSPPSKLAVGTPHIGARLEQNLSFDEICDEQSLSKCNRTTELFRGKEASNSKGDESEQLSKAHVNHSCCSRNDICVVAMDWENRKVVRGPRTTTPKRRKKLAIRQRARQEVSDATLVGRPKEKTKKRKGSPPEKVMATDDVGHPKEKTKQKGSPTKKVMACESSLVPEEVKDSLDNGGSKSRGNEQIDILATHVLTPQVASVARYGTSLNCSTVISSSSNTRVQEISNFVNGLNGTDVEAENRPLPAPPFKEGRVVEGSNVDPRVQETPSFGDRLDVTGNEGMKHQAESIDVAHEDDTPDMLLSKSASSVQVTALTDLPPTRLSPVKIALPFVKSSSVWDAIESMEVFHIMPQEPHFRPMEQYSMEFREGVAIGLMVTFASLAASARKLNIFDSQAAFEGILKAIVPLKENGFDVQRIQSRVEELLEIHNNLQHFGNKKNTLEEQIIVKETEKDQLETLKSALDKTISEVEQHLTRFREERDLVNMQRIDNELQMANLQKDVQATNETCLFAEEQFNTILNSQW